jgi:hypothetical protein
VSSCSWLQGRFGLVDQQRESRRIARRHFRQNLAVQAHPGHFQAVHELAVGKARLPAARVDAHNPQRTEFALLVFAADVSVFERLLDGFLRRAI